MALVLVSLLVLPICMPPLLRDSRLLPFLNFKQLPMDPGLPYSNSGRVVSRGEVLDLRLVPQVVSRPISRHLLQQALQQRPSRLAAARV